MEGITTWRTKKGWLVFQIHYTADPDKRTPEWKQGAIDSMPDLQSYNREFEIDWASTTGLPFYPAFYKTYAENRSYYVRTQEAPNGIIYRGFDFGFHRPACVWAWLDNAGTLRVLREFCPRQLDVYDFREAVKFLSGETDQIQASRPRAISWCDRVLAGGERWFKKGTKFINFCGVEAKKTQSLTGDFGEMNDFEVFEGGGVSLSIVNQRVSAGTYILRNLMKDRNGSPGIQVDPSCLTLLHGLAGGLTFGDGSKSTPLDDEVAIHPELSHIHDALRYLVTGVINVSDVQSRMNSGYDKAPREPETKDRRKEPPRYGPSEKPLEDLPFWAGYE